MRARDMEATERAHLGAAELDIIWPGWFRKVKLRQLDIASECNCVLGQLGRDAGGVGFMAGSESFRTRTWGNGRRLMRGWSDRYGFTAARGPRSDYRNLTVAWKKEIRARRRGFKNAAELDAAALSPSGTVAH